MDAQLTLHELTRLEAERKLRTIPRKILETTWVREAQVEAVIDAVLVVGVLDAEAVALARHAGEWSARIAQNVSGGPNPALARRAAVLSDVAPALLEQIPELRHVAEAMRQPTVATIVQIARDFAVHTAPDARGHMVSPKTILRAMIASANERTLPIVEALQAALQPKNCARVASMGVAAG